MHGFFIDMRSQIYIMQYKLDSMMISTKNVNAYALLLLHIIICYIITASPYTIQDPLIISCKNDLDLLGNPCREMSTCRVVMIIRCKRDFF